MTGTDGNLDASIPPAARTRFKTLFLASASGHCAPIQMLKTLANGGFYYRGALRWFLDNGFRRSRGISAVIRDARVFLLA